MKVCRICLAADRKMFNLDTKHKQLYESVTGITVHPDQLPKHICWECRHFMSKYYTFKSKAVKSYFILMKIFTKQNKTFTALEKHQPKSTLTRTGILYSNLDGVDTEELDEIAAVDDEGVIEFKSEADREGETNFTSHNNSDINVIRDNTLIDYTYDEANLTTKVTRNESGEIVSSDDLKIESVENVSNVEISEEIDKIVNEMQIIEKPVKSFNNLEITSDGVQNDIDIETTEETVPNHNNNEILYTKFPEDYTDDDENESYVSNNSDEISCNSIKNTSSESIDEISQSKNIIGLNKPLQTVTMLSKEEYITEMKKEEANSSCFKESLDIDPLKIPTDGPHCGRCDLRFASQEAFDDHKTCSTNHADKRSSMSSPPTEDIAQQSQSDFSATDGSDFDPANYSVDDEEYGTENEFYDDPIVRRSKKRLIFKPQCEKLYKKISKAVQSSSKDIPEESNSPKTQKQVHMEYEEPKENNCQNKFGNTKRSWTRRNACFYCQQVVTNFTRHLLRNHPNEYEVIQYKSIKDDDPKIRKMKRQEVSDKIRNKGNFLHNSKVCFDRDGSKTLIPAKRRDVTSSPSSFATCKNCLGTFKRSTFFRHFKKCGTNTCKGRVLTNNSITIIPNTDTASKELKKKILPHMRSDETALVVKNDRLILAYGTRLLKKKKERRSRKAICSKMRDLATLLMLIRKHDCSIETLTDALDPEKYEVFIASVKEMCGFNEDTGQVRVPSIPARILPAVLGCVDILYTQSIMSSESTAFKNLHKMKLDNFKQLVTINWQLEISSNAEKTKKRRNMVKENVLPLEDDIKTVMETIAKLEVKYARKLKIDCNVINYESLCTVTIAHIIMLDRKRAGDVAEAELTFYINRRNEEIPEEVLKTLTPDQRKSIKTLDVFQIPGKRTRSVPILLTKTMKENIDLIIACRDDLKIPQTNALLFARPCTDEPFDGGKCLDKIKKLCNLKRPEMVTSTGMRHHIATMSQLHSTQNDKYTEHLAGFLGHDIAVHAKNYRLPLQVLEKAVVGSQLMKYEPHQNRSPPQIIYTKKQIMVPRLEDFEESVQSNEEAIEKNSEFAKENSEDENSKEVKKSKHNKEKSKEENEEDDKKKSDEENEDGDEKSEEKDNRVESNQNHEEKSEEKNQEDMLEELIISKSNKNFKKINLRNNLKYASNIQTRFKRKQTETKEKINKKVTKSKKTQLDILCEESCEKPIEKNSKKRPLQDNDEDIDQTENKKKKNVKKQKKALLGISSTSEESCEKLIQKNKTKNIQDSDEIVRRRKTDNDEDIDQTENKKKKNVKKQKKALLDISSTSEESCEKLIQKNKTKNIQDSDEIVRRRKTDNDEDIDQTENKKKKNVKKQKKALLDISSTSEESCEKLIQKNKTKNIQDSDEIVRRRKTTHKFWTEEETKAVKLYFKKNIKNKINPGKAKCVEVLKKAPVLQSRTWMQLNSYVNNIYKNK